MHSQDHGPFLFDIYIYIYKCIYIIFQFDQHRQLEIKDKYVDNAPPPKCSSLYSTCLPPKFTQESGKPGAHGDIRSLDSMSTMPDPEQDMCKLFLKMLMETPEEDVLRKKIVGSKALFTELGFEKLPPNIRNQCRLVQEFSEKATHLGNEKKAIEEEMNTKVHKFSNHYDNMLKKLHERHPDDQSSPRSMFYKKALLDRWLHDQKASAMEPVMEIQFKINLIEAEISKAVEKVIHETWNNDPTSQPQLVSQGTKDIMGELTKEMEELMDTLVLDTNAGDGDSLLKQKTLTLGETPENEVNAVAEDYQEQVTKQLDDRKLDETTGDSESKGDGLMRSPSSENVALRHIEQMPDGPAKSALLAILEAAAAKACGPVFLLGLYFYFNTMF